MMFLERIERFFSHLFYRRGECGGKVFSPDLAYSSAREAAALEKTEGEDFVILNLTDIQTDHTFDCRRSGAIYKTIKSLIDDKKPKLITISGDILWGIHTRQCQRKLIAMMESFEIPWAPVFGNHDSGGNADLLWLGERFEEAERCLFQRGFNNIGGVGNYIINIRENGKTIHSLIMIDSGSQGNCREAYDEQSVYGSSDAVNGDSRVGKKEFGTLNIGQLEWYKWVINGLKAENNGSTVETSVILHIPLMEYDLAYSHWAESGYDPAIGTGSKNEKIASPCVNIGFFDTILEIGSTKKVIAGHDHVNDFSILYKGVRLTYSVKTGFRCYHQKDGSMNGGSILTIDDTGKATITQCYVKI